MTYSVRQRLVRGGIVALVGKSAVAVGVVILNALIARLLTPLETGLFFIALSIVSVAAVVADFGFGKTLLRVIPDAIALGDNSRALSHIRHVFTTAVVTVAATAMLLVGPPGTWIAGQLSHGSLPGSLMPLVAVWLAVTVFMSLLAETCRGFHQIGDAIFYGGAVTGLGNILTISLLLVIVSVISFPLSLGDLIMMFIITGAVLSVIAASRLVKRMRSHRSVLQKERERYRALFTLAWPFWISSMALVLLTNAEIWILGLLRTPEEVAAFGLVAKVALLVNFPLVIVNNVLPPLISELYAKDDIVKMQRMLRASAGITTVCSGFVFLVLLVGGEWLPALLFGEYFTGNWDIMMILAAGWLFHVWAGSGGFVLNMTDNQKSVMLINIVAGLYTVLSGVWLTSMYGGLGMAIAASSGLVLINTLMLLRIRKKLGIRIYAGVSGLSEVVRDIRERQQAARS